MRPIRPSLNHIWITTFAEYDADGTLLREEGYWYDGPVVQAGGGMAAVIEQEHYRIRNDNTAADPGTPNWISTEDQATRTVINVDTMFRIRFVIANTGDANANATYALYFSHEGGTYTAVAASGTAVITADATTPTDADALTTANFQLSAGTGNAANGEYDENNSISNNLAAGDYTEFEYCVQLNSAVAGGIANGDTFDFIVYYDGAQADQVDFTALVEASIPAIEGDTTFTIDASQTDNVFKSLTGSISYINQLAQNQNQMISINEALSFILQVAQQETGDIVIPLSVDLAAATNFILQNVLTGEKQITISTLLDQFSQNNIQTYQDTIFGLNLTDTYIGSAAAVIAGEVILGTTLAYQSTALKALEAAANINVVLDKASQVSRLFDEAANFSFTLNFDSDYLGVVTFDDPVYSAGNYIFVDLTNVGTILSGAIKSASITFTTSQGQTQTVGLIGQAAATLLTQLIQNQTANKLTAAQHTFAANLDESYLASILKTAEFDVSLNLDKLSSLQVDALKAAVQSINVSQNQSVTLIADKALTLSKSLDLNSIKQLVGDLDINLTTNLDETSLSLLAQLAAFNAGINVDKLSSLQVDALKAASYLTAVSQNQSVLNITDQTLDLNTLLDYSTLNQLIGDVEINLGTTLDYLHSIQSDLSDAVTFLSSLDFISFGDSGIDAISNFNINVLITDQVQSLLNSTLILISNMSEAASKQAVTDKAIEYLIQLSVRYNSDIAGAISFILQMQQIDTVQLTAEKAIAIVSNLAEQYDVNLTTAETLTLAIQLADSYSPSKTIPAQIALNASLQQTQSTLVDKLITISFGLALDHISTNKVDFNAFASLISAYTASMLGSVAGAIDGFVTFASQISQDNTSISTYNKNITFTDLFSKDSVISSLDYYKNLDIVLQVDQNQDYNLTQLGSVVLNTFYSKLDTAKIDYVPSIDFNLEALSISDHAQGILVNALLGIEQSMLRQSSIGFTALADFGLQQNYETEIRLTLQGTAQLTTQLSESTAITHLRQVGITFGHLLGLSALSRAGFAEDITFGTISDLRADGFVLEFTITLPEGRTLKIYFEDRLTIIYPEDRIIKVT